MTKEEIEKKAKKMVDNGLTVVLKSGATAITIALSDPNELPPLSREERKKLLKKKFEQLNQQYNSELEIDLDTISVAAQSVKAKISVKKLKALFEEITSFKHFNIKPLTDETMA